MSRKLVSRVFISLFYFLPINDFRKFKTFVVRLCGAEIDKNVTFSPGLFILNGRNLSIGRDSNIGVNGVFIDIDKIYIGQNLLMSSGVQIISGTHEISKFYKDKSGMVIIGDNVWIGAGVIIVGPCTIGDNCVIGANSFVTGNFSSNSLIVGNPAIYKKQIKC
jgi:maltose O-acetyltransferase